jgi:DNA-binding NarL/FixJ family response regulator
MAQGRSNRALSDELYLSAKTIEAHVRNIFTKLDLPPDAGDHRRVLAVLAFLRS